jgi:hypothetical protein
MGTILWAAIIVAIAIAWGIGVVDIFRRRLDVMHTVAWLLLVLILPVIGTIVYWVLRPEDPDALERKAAAQADIRRGRQDRPHDGPGLGM